MNSNSYPTVAIFPLGTEGYMSMIEHLSNEVLMDQIAPRNVKKNTESVKSLKSLNKYTEQGSCQKQNSWGLVRGLFG